MEQENNRAREQAILKLEHIKQMVERYQHARDCTGTVEDKNTGQNRKCTEGHDTYESEYHDEGAAREAIEEDALDVQVRSGWSTPDSADWEPEQYTILLCTGGPAVRIKGNLDNGQPATAQLEYQDWGTLWTRLNGLTDDEIDALLTYAECHYYGT